MSVLLIGAGPMAVAHAKALSRLGRDFTVVGRGEGSAETFARETGICPIGGGLATYLLKHDEPIAAAILAVNVTSLAEAAIALIRHGVKRILLEKPGGLNLAEVEKVAQIASEAGSQVFVAYNRRFFSSTEIARQMIIDDGGVTSVQCNFTEAAFRIGAGLHPPHVMRNWFFMNSTHVLDLGLHLGGIPRNVQGLRCGGLDWHPDGAIFAGHGLLSNGGVFAYFADWSAPGRWGVEVATRRRRLILQPLETLRVQNKGSFAVEEVPLRNEVDIKFKPGVLRMLEAFFDGEQNLCTLDVHLQHCRDVYEVICPTR